MKPRRKPWTQRNASSLGAGEVNAVRLRLAWEQLAAKVRSAFSLTGALDDRDLQLTLMNLTAQCGRAAPPFEAEPVRTVAAGFRQMVEGCLASHPERRAAMADTMVAGARLVDGFLAEERNRLAQGWRRHSGGD